ncbi:MAG: MaoC family dehydratase N-terminal domain-containing protein [Deltaproteobacteria bacterium]|nr:MaoC family dehydratase N-terminal domain-containing protein [Deltaproteobacteria bacterium]
MPIDRDKAMAYEFPEGTGSYSNDEVILYHLGVGAGVPATDAGELEYTYEKNLKVLPSFVTTVFLSGGGSMMSVPGLEFNPMMLLHGEQDIEIHRPLPPEAKMKGRTRIADIYDKGKAALTILENSVSTEDGEPLFTTRMALFMRGEGGFGGESGPPAANQAPDREPDAVFEAATLPQQALLYRLNGDKNPLHCDPEFASMGGFDVPIIHGLCSYGITCKAVVDGMLDGDPTRVARYQARFKGVAWPGETYQVRCWKEDGKILIEAWSKERNEAIITNAAVTLR